MTRTALGLLVGAAVGLASPALGQQAADDWGEVPPGLSVVVVIVGDGIGDGSLIIGDSDGPFDDAALGERGRKALQYRVGPGTYVIEVEGRKSFEWEADPNDPLFLWIGAQPRPPMLTVRGVRRGAIDAPEPMRIEPAGNTLRFSVER